MMFSRLLVDPDQRAASGCFSCAPGYTYQLKNIAFFFLTRRVIKCPEQEIHGGKMLKVFQHVTFITCS